MNGTYQINPAFITQKIGGKVGVFDAEKSVMHTFNDTAATIFLGFQLAWPKEKIIKKLMDTYKIEKKTATADVDTIMADMVKKQVLIKKSS